MELSVWPLIQGLDSPNREGSLEEMALELSFNGKTAHDSRRKNFFLCTWNKSDKGLEQEIKITRLPIRKLNSLSIH